MNDSLVVFDEYKCVKEIDDLIEETKELREYYFAEQFDKMKQHINELTRKYLVETSAWNATHRYMPTTNQQAYMNAEVFLRSVGCSILLKKGFKLPIQVTPEEAEFLKSITIQR